MGRQKKPAGRRPGKSEAAPESSVPSASAPQRGRWNFVISLLPVVLIFVAFAWFYSPQGPSNPAPSRAIPIASHPELPTEEQSVRAMASELNALRTEQLGLMHAVGDGDDEAEALIRFHEEHARYGHLTSSAEIEFPAASAEEREREMMHPDPLRYFVVELSPEGRQRLGYSTPTYMTFDHRTKVLFTYRGETHFQPALAGAIILHEVQHAYDRVTGREEMFAPSILRLPGERRAYRLETRLLRRYTSGALDVLLEQALAARGTSRNYIPLSGISRAEREAFRVLFPGIGSGEALDYRLGMFDFGIMLNLERARRNSLGVDWELGSIEFTQSHPQL